MRQYSAENGFANDWHLVNYGKFAQAGAGMVVVETAAVEARGRITYGDLGIWSNEHVALLARIASFIREQGAVPAIQLGHAGRMSGMQRPWEGGGALGEAQIARGEAPWQGLAPSAIPFAPEWPVPLTMTNVHLEEVAAAWEAAARRAIRAGFDALELHCASGYLLHEFLSPTTNLRSDAYGGDARRRMTYPLHVVKRVRAVWPPGKPLLCRVPVADDSDGDAGIEESIEFSREIKSLGVDVIACSAGGIRRYPTSSKRSRSVAAGVSCAAQIRNGAHVSTMAEGSVFDAQLAEDILASAHADLIGIANEAVFNPNWPLHARGALESDGFDEWPRQYGWRLEKQAFARES